MGRSYHTGADESREDTDEGGGVENTADDAEGQRECNVGRIPALCEANIVLHNDIDIVLQTEDKICRWIYTETLQATSLHMYCMSAVDSLVRVERYRNVCRQCNDSDAILVTLTIHHYAFYI